MADESSTKSGSKRLWITVATFLPFILGILLWLKSTQVCPQIRLFFSAPVVRVEIVACGAMAIHESALQAIYENDLYASDVEEGEIEYGEFTVGLQPMDVDTGELSDGEVFTEDGHHPPGRSVNLRDPQSDHVVTANGHNKDLESKSGGGQVSNDSDTSERTGRAASRGGKKSKKKRSGKRRTVDVARFVRETCDHLQEKKISLIWALVRKLGMEAVRGLVNEVNVIQKCGGQMTNDKKRHRTPGGVLWNILKGRVQPQVYKEIMSQGNEVLKQKTKEAKETLKRQRMDIDEPANKKRRKVTNKEADTPMAGSDGKQVTWPNPSIRVPRDFRTLTDGLVRDDAGPSVTQVLKAWIEGLRKKDDLDDVVTPVPTILKTGPEESEGPADSVKSLEKSVRVTDRLRVPVEYGDVEKGEADDGADELRGSSR
ncbi:hypothetical protein R1flu_015641 [Riccia fluitans]|uniref:Phosphorylated adapter RNA export protein n=1 Tax=Riccia fluitans TaxID=41844 RepID=A0ABD1YKE1_9MARC